MFASRVLAVTEISLLYEYVAFIVMIIVCYLVKTATGVYSEPLPPPAFPKILGKVSMMNNFHGYESI